MEEVILRFPHLTGKIFAQLNNKSLARCREVSKTWKTILDQEKFLHIRSIQSYITKRHDIGDRWKEIFKISNTEMIILIKSAVEKVYSEKAFWDKKRILNPLHVAAKFGQKYLFEYVEEKLGDKSEKCNLGLTTIHFAAGNGHLDLCKYIMENTEDKSPRTNKGGRPLHAAALRGHLDVCKYIMENTEDKSPRCNDGQTPLHLTALKGHLNVFKYIFEIIDDKSPTDNLGRTPIDFACLGDQQKFVDFIQSYNFKPKLKRRKGEEGKEF